MHRYQLQINLNPFEIPMKFKIEELPIKGCWSSGPIVLGSNIINMDAREKEESNNPHSEVEGST